MWQRGGAEHDVPMQREQTIVVTAANDAHDRKWEGTELDCLDAEQHTSGTLDQDKRADGTLIF